MIERHYCTYFDHRYLARGLALRQSMLVHAPGHVLWVLCLSDECERILRSAALPGVRIVTLPELEAGDPELAATRSTRSLVEYYFTCSPCLPRHILSKCPEVEAITYLDSDLFFFSSPEPIFSELGLADVGIVPHRFPAHRAADLERYGRYNVGWMTFRRSKSALSCLDWWRERCIEWCYDRLEADRFADQKYLDRFETLFAGVHSISNVGCNLAPWNVANYAISGEVPLIDDRPLVFYHFHGLKQLSRSIFDAHLYHYDANLTREIQSRIYQPYLAELLRAQQLAIELGKVGGRSEFLRGSARATGSLNEAFRRIYLIAKSAFHGDLIRVRSA